MIEDFKMINIAICDDNNSYSQIIDFKLQKILNELNTEYKIFIADSLEQLQNYCENNNLDIVFLDICIGEQNAIDWTIENSKNKNSQFIFMTSYPEEAFNLSETNFCYFLVKSKMTDDQLKRATLKAISEITKKNEHLLILKSKDMNYAVDLQKITYIESFNNSIVIHIEDQENIVIYSTLKAFIDLCPPNFLRCHKSYAVNMNSIKGYYPHKFVLPDGSCIPIPPKKYKEIIKRYKNYLD